MSTRFRKPDHIWENHDGFIIPGTDPNKKTSDEVNLIASERRKFSSNF